MNKIKVPVTAALSALMSWLGILAVPVFLLVGSNLIDYATGLAAAARRREQISSYRSIWGITKKVCQWLLVIVGAMVDALIKHAVASAGISITVPFVVATVVTVWLVVNEIISILENMVDIGVAMPPFLLPLVRYIREQTEAKATIVDQEDGEGGVETTEAPREGRNE